jgi:hypothetical protein
VSFCASTSLRAYARGKNGGLFPREENSKQDQSVQSAFSADLANGLALP